MKKSYLIVTLVLALVFFAFSAISINAADFSVATPSTPSGDVGTSVQFQVSITNHNSTTTRSYIITGTGLNGPGGTISQPNSVGSNPIGPGATSITSLAVNLPIITAGTYTGTITVKDTTVGGEVSVPYSVIVNEKRQIQMIFQNSQNYLSIQAEPKTTTQTITSTSFQIKNTGSVIINNIQIPTATFSDGSGNQYTVTGTVDTQSLSPGSSSNARITLTIPSDTFTDTFTQAISITSPDLLTPISFNLNTKVQPLACKNGETGSITADINTPDSGDDYDVGDTISMEVDVYNDGSNSEDYIVKSVLYDKTKNKKIETAESDVESIDNGDSYNFQFDMPITSDTSINDGDDFVIYVKAYRDGSESTECTQESVDININVPSHKLTVVNPILNPSTVTCGSTVIASAEVRNDGRNTEGSVRFRVRETDLNINQVTNLFSLAKSGKSDDTQSNSLTFKIPTNAKTGDYTIEFVAEAGSGITSTEFATLHVDCGEGSTSTITGAVSLTMPSYTIKANQGSSFDLPLTLQNNADSQKTYTIEAKAAGDFATSDSQSITLGSNEQGIATLSMNIDAAASTGTRTVAITVKDGNNVVLTKSVSIVVESKGTPVTGTSTTGLSNLFNTSSYTSPTDYMSQAGLNAGSFSF